MQYLKIYFLFTSAVFRCPSNDITLKGLLSSSMSSFLIILLAIVTSEMFFARAYFRPDFSAIRRKKFAARYFWFKARLKQKKFIFEQYSVNSTWEIEICRFYFQPAIISRFLGAGPLKSRLVQNEQKQLYTPGILILSYTCTSVVYSRVLLIRSICFQICSSCFIK